MSSTKPQWKARFGWSNVAAEDVGISRSCEPPRCEQCPLPWEAAGSLKSWTAICMPSVTVVLKAANLHLGLNYSNSSFSANVQKNTEAFLTKQHRTCERCSEKELWGSIQRGYLYKLFGN